jgi:hypothetical protein
MYKSRLLFVLTTAFLLITTACNKNGNREKEEFIEQERIILAQKGFREEKMLKRVEDSDVCISLLQPDGKFQDLLFLHDKWDSLNQPYVQQQQQVGDYIEKAFVRLWKIAELFRGGNMPEENPEELRKLVFKSYILYHELEKKRPDIGRFHQSCFAMPRSGINTYFCFFDIMEEIEKGTLSDPLFEKGRKAMIDIGFQSWTQPRRLDETDDNIISIDRFRNHVWWVGGNALAYRALFESAVMMSSVEMMDVLAEVSKNAISAVSQTSYDDSFWAEGLTADGAGWGHGMQCLVWGYPIHGTKAALNNLNRFSGSPWAKKLSRENIDWLFNYLRGSAFLYHKGIEPPAFSRHSMVYKDVKPQNIPSLEIVNNLLENWESSLSYDEVEELRQFKKEAEAKNLIMENYPDGNYHGSRYFFNNDNFAKKTTDYYSLISMASIRCDGIESYYKKADGFNLFTCDGMTLFQRSGEEYKKALGAWNLTAVPGVTARQLNYLKPFTNWRGYTSKHNFAAGATNGGSNGVTGFIFEKLNGSAKKDVNDRTGLEERNPEIFGIKAYKSYFWFGDLFLAMGAGITNLETDIDKPVWTTIEQTLAIGENIELSTTKKVNKEEIIWIQNNEFSYAVLPEYTSGEVYYSIEQRNTFYDSLNVTNKKIDYEPEELDIFQMWIDHGNHPQNDSYAYLVNCNPDIEVKIPTIISNDSTLQAACSDDEKTICAVFYSPEQRLEVGGYWFEVSAECALMVELQGEQVVFTVCDAKMDQNLNSISVRTNMQLKGNDISNDGTANLLNVDLPVEPFRGKPISIKTRVH